MTDNLSTENASVDDGGNFAPTELRIGADARKLIATYERQIRRHDKITADIHQTIVAFGRLLLAGKAMYPSDKEFGWWIERRNLNTGRLARHQTERSACMAIARLYDVGTEIDEVPVHLDLTGCTVTTPTDIQKWARRTQRHLFPHLPPREPRPAGRAGSRELEAEIAARDEQIAGLRTDLEIAHRVLARDTTAPEAHACTFCGKDGSEVFALFTIGPSDSPAICDECVDEFTDVLYERRHPRLQWFEADSDVAGHPLYHDDERGPDESRFHITPMASATGRFRHYVITDENSRIGEARTFDEAADIVQRHADENPEDSK